MNGKEYITIKEMAEKLGKKPNAVKQLLYNANIKPVSREALYDLEAFETIKKAPSPGRPKNPAVAKAETTLADFREAVKSGDLKAIIAASSRHQDSLFEVMEAIATVPGGDALNKLLSEAGGRNSPLAGSKKTLSDLEKLLDAREGHSKTKGKQKRDSIEQAIISGDTDKLITEFLGKDFKGIFPTCRKGRPPKAKPKTDPSPEPKPKKPKK